MVKQNVIPVALDITCVGEMRSERGSEGEMERAKVKSLINHFRPELVVCALIVGELDAHY
jgi:hypothetical protein